MRVYNRYIISLALLLMTTTVALAFAGQDQLDLYFAAYLIECLIVTLLFAHLNRSGRRALGIIGVFLFIGFICIVISRVLGIIMGINALGSQ